MACHTAPSGMQQALHMACMQAGSGVCATQHSINWRASRPSAQGRADLKHRPGLGPLSTCGPHISWREGRLLVSNRNGLPLAAIGVGS